MKVRKVQEMSKVGWEAVRGQWGRITIRRQNNKNEAHEESVQNSQSQPKWKGGKEQHV